jgi:hypothetical protein
VIVRVHARASRVYAAPSHVVARAIDIDNVRTGSPEVVWNETRTSGKETSDEFIFDVQLSAIDSNHTKATLDVTVTSRRWKLPVLVFGKPALALTLHWLKPEVTRQLEAEAPAL